MLTPDRVKGNADALTRVVCTVIPNMGRGMGSRWVTASWALKIPIFVVGKCLSEVLAPGLEAPPHQDSPLKKCPGFWNLISRVRGWGREA